MYKIHCTIPSMKSVDVKVQLSIKISPRYFNDPEYEIDEQLSSYLFKYTYKLSGIPICYKVVGIYPVGSIVNDSHNIYVKTIVMFTLIRFSVGDTLPVEYGTVYGIVPVSIQDDHTHTGYVRVLGIENTKDECSCVIGERV